MYPIEHIKKIFFNHLNKAVYRLLNEKNSFT